MISLSHLPEPVIVLIKALVDRVSKAPNPEGVARAAEEAARITAFDQAMTRIRQ
jgi:hypothetical protein